MAAKAFTGIGSANTAGNWTPTGVPSRTASGGDDVTFTTFPTGGAINAKTVTLPSVSANLSLVDFSNVGTLILAGINYQNDNSIFLPAAGLVLAGSGGFGVDPTGVGGPTTPSLDPVAEIGPGNVLTGAGGTYVEPAQNAYSSDGPGYGPGGGNAGLLDADAIVSTTGYGNLDPAYIVNADSGTSAGGTLDPKFVATPGLDAGTLSANSIVDDQGSGTDADGAYEPPDVTAYSANGTVYGPVSSISGTLDANRIVDLGGDGLGNLPPANVYPTNGIGTLRASNIGTVAGTDNLATTTLKLGQTVDDVVGNYGGGGGGGTGVQSCMIIPLE